MESSATENLCRLCDKKSGIMLSVFQKNSEGLQILNVIKDCLPLVIYRTDPLSKFICNECHNNLETLYNFKKGVLEVNNQHRKQLKENVSNFKVQLYLDIVDNNNSSNEKLQNGDRSAKLIMKDTSTLTDSFQYSRMDDDSDLNSLNSIMIRVNGHNNNDMDSDMDICEDMNSERDRVMLKCRNMEPYTMPIVKKKRVIGPKCQMSPNPRIKMTKFVRYDPFTLLKCILHSQNKQHVPDYDEKPFEVTEMEREEIIPLCVYCEAVFDNENDLALHEMQYHIKLNLEKVDADGYWSMDESNALVRNKWYNAQFDSEECSTMDDEADADAEIEEEGDEEMEEDEEDESEDLLVPMDEDTEMDMLNVARSSDIVFVNEQPTLNGTSLKDIPKDERGDFYQSVRLNGANRKFCNLCRYTFKDNWAIELHYMSRTCYYSCNYCGVKFNKNKYSFAKHIDDHKAAGHFKSDKVFVNKSKSGTVPKLLSASCLRPFIPSTSHYRKFISKVKPIKIKSLMEKKNVDTLKMKDDLVQIKTEPGLTPMTTADLQKSDNKAYFCKKCYQVFCRLNEYNEHNKLCTGEIMVPEMQVIRPYLKKDKEPLIKTPVKTKIENDVEVYSSTGRPVRHCVKEISSYCDDVEYKPPPSTPPTTSAAATTTATTLPKLIKSKQRNSPGQFECTLCSSVFPTVHSRNSHMRIHKVGFRRAPASPPPSTQRLPSRYESMTSPEPMNPAKRIKREQDTFEPIVEIHEGPSTKVPSNIGSVSITPINQRNKVSAEIMELVQNNPNITIKTKSDSPASSYGGSSNKSNQQLQQRQQQQQQQQEQLQQHHSLSPSSLMESSSAEKTYKCSSCSQPFANKSNLYFHKKNQCGGSRYPCPFCKKRFGTEATYSAHIFYSHPV